VRAAVGQPLITRRGDAELVEVARGPRAIVDDVEVAEGAAEVAELHRHATQDFLLHGAGELPAVHPLAPASQNPGVVGAAGAQGPEVGVAERAALAVGGKVLQVTVWPEVAVGVAPRSRGARDDALRRVEAVAEDHARVGAAP